MNSKSKPSIILIIILGFNLTIPHLMVYHISRKWVQEDYDNRIHENVKISAGSEKIHIIGNTGWIDFKSAGNCTGSGTPMDPYIIEDLIIDAEESGDCIYIGYSNVNFVIRNCTVSKAGPNWDNGGIKLDNCQNGFLINNTCSFNLGEQTDGIHLLSSSKITLFNNKLISNWYGIYLGYSFTINVSENKLNDNYVGMRIYNSDKNIFANNTVNNSKFAGIFIYESDENYIFGNSAFSNRDAIPLLESNSNNILENMLTNNEENGIELIKSNYNCISDNNVNKNNKNGILLRDQSNYNMITDNLIKYNSESGINLKESHTNEIYDNYVNNNNIGIELFFSNFNRITKNKLIYNGMCILSQDSENNTIFSNSCIEYSFTPDFEYFLFYSIPLLGILIITLNKNKKIKNVTKSKIKSKL